VNSGQLDCLLPHASGAASRRARAAPTLARTASAVIEAKRFHARKAALVVHSFSTQQDGFADFLGTGLARRAARARLGVASRRPPG
jgi:hypothetical protein